MTEIVNRQNFSIKENDSNNKSNGTDSSQMSTLSRFKDLILDSDPNIGLEDSVLPEYKKMKIVGKGSFGVAILYKRVSDDILVVLKQINLSELTNSEKELAMNEVDVFSKLHHPNIISYLGSFIRGETLIIEMEYADKGTLAQIINERSVNDYLPENQIINVFEQITSAINYMHSQNILHRDLKTANVFLNSKGTVKIGDFGISKIMNTKIHAQTVLGTPYYFSPEMCEGKEYDEKSDMWALGCILGEMCCLKKAFAASNLSELVAKIMSAHYLPLPSGYSNELRHVIKLLLQIEPNERPSASEILKYWIPLIYRNANQRKKGNEYVENNNNEHYQSDINEEEFQENATIMNESTATMGERIIERSVLYQLKSFGGNISLIPLQLPPIILITQVATSESHFIVISAEGLAYTWGEGNRGQLGHGSINTWKHYPTKVESLRKYNILGASAGEGFSLFWTDTGIVLSCGDNSKGCLGQGNLSSYLTPRIVEKLNGIEIVEIASGNQHVIARSKTGHIYIWGASHYIIGKQSLFITPRTVNTSHLNDTVISLRCGPDCSILILNNGELYVCGKNTNNRLGFGKNVKKINTFRKITVINKKVIDVSVTQTFGAYLIEGGYIITLGQNCSGQRGLGHDNQPQIDVPTMVTGIKNKFITKVKCCTTYVVVISDENIISLWGKRHGIPEECTTNSNSSVLNNRPLETFDSVNNTAAFTNFLTSVYKSEKILDPIDILALFSSEDQRSKGYFIKLEDIFPLHHSILILVTTTSPLGYK